MLEAAEDGGLEGGLSGGVVVRGAGVEVRGAGVEVRGAGEGEGEEGWGGPADPDGELGAGAAELVGGGDNG